MPINRQSIALPGEVSQEILQKVQDESAVMRLADEIPLPGPGVTIPMITSDPEADWVAEGAAKPVSAAGLDKKMMTPYKLAVIVPFSEEFTRDYKRLYDALVQRMPRALGMKFDRTVIGAVQKPGNNFDNFAGCTAQSIQPASNHTTYAGLVAADADIGEHMGILNGFALSPAARALLLNAVDSVGRPLFINNTAEGAIPMILGAPTYLNRGLYKAGTAASGSGSSAVAAAPAIVGVAGDWTQAKYGTVEGVKIDISNQATLTYLDDQNQTVTLNLWQQNMVAVRAEIEVGFRADTTVFNLLTGATPA